MTTEQIEITFRVSRDEAAALLKLLRRADARGLLSPDELTEFDAASEKLRSVLRILLSVTE